MNLAMGVGSVLCVLFGVAPFLLYDLLPNPVEYLPFRAYPIAESLLTLSGAFIVFHFIKGRLLTPGILRDLDTPLRALMPWIKKTFVDLPWAIFEAVEEVVLSITRVIVAALRNPLAWLQPTIKNEGGSPAHHSESFTPAIEVVMGLVLLTFIVLGIFLIL